MKVCPICQIRYDEETLRFCTKDGAPLVEETVPAFTELPGETTTTTTTVKDDFAEETIISRRLPQPETDVIEETKPLSAPPRIVIPTDEPARKTTAPPQAVRARTTTVYQTEPHRKSNTGKIVALTLLGTFLILGSAALLYMMTRDNSSNTGNVNRTINVNADAFNSVPDTNLNTNLNFGNVPENFNANANFNTQTNSISNGNTRTPPPTPTPTRPPILNSNINISNPNPPPSAAKTATPAPAVSPKPSVTPTATPTAAPKPSPSVVPPPPPTPPPPAANRPITNQ